MSRSNMLAHTLQVCLPASAVPPMLVQVQGLLAKGSQDSLGLAHYTLFINVC